MHQNQLHEVWIVSASVFTLLEIHEIGSVCIKNKKLLIAWISRGYIAAPKRILANLRKDFRAIILIRLS